MSSNNRNQSTDSSVKIYYSYGSGSMVTIIGHVFKTPPIYNNYKNNFLATNFVNLLKLFKVETLANQDILIIIGNEKFYTKSEIDGFFKIEINLNISLDCGWNIIQAAILDSDKKGTQFTQGHIYVPHKTQYVFISDIDDTVIISHSSTIIRRLYELMSRHPRKRRIFDNTAKFYKALSESNTDGGLRHPFFYVSSSEWNLYEYLKAVFSYHQLPKGVFLLNTLKKLRDVFKIEQLGYEGKLTHIYHIIKAYPEHQFILIGDNTQKDPYLYNRITEKYPSKIKAVLIRNIVKNRYEKTISQTAFIQESNIHFCLFDTTQEVIKYCRDVGLIHDR